MSRKTRKTATCPTCCPNDAFATYRKHSEYGDDDKFHPYWECTNCGHRLSITPRRSFTPHTINTRQQRTLDRLHAELLRDDDRHEWKSFDVSTTDYGTVWLSCETGMKNDEGTAASIICRDNWHIQIKAGGGTHVHRSPNWTKCKRI